MKEIFGKKLKNQPNPLGFKDEVRPKLEKWLNREEQETHMLMALITRDLLPPWMRFYDRKMVFNPNIDFIPKKTLTKLRR